MVGTGKMASYLAALLVSLCILGLSRVEGRGYVLQPISRQALRTSSEDFTEMEVCPQCYNSGGPEHVKSQLAHQSKIKVDCNNNVLPPVWPLADKTPEYLKRTYKLPFPALIEHPTIAKRHGICGDPAKGNVNAEPRYTGKISDWEVPKESIYPAEAVIEVKVVVTTHQKGHFEFFLCHPSNLVKPDFLDNGCFNYMPLRRVPSPDDVSPVDPRFPGRYYLEPRQCIDENGGVAGFSGNVVKMYYQLPNVDCEHCVLRWWWVTGSTCNVPDYSQLHWNLLEASDRCPAGIQWMNPSLPDCGDVFPEEFWNCMDIKITRNGLTGTNKGYNTASAYGYANNGYRYGEDEQLNEVEGGSEAIDESASFVDGEEGLLPTTIKTHWVPDWSSWSSTANRFVCKCKEEPRINDETNDWGFPEELQCIDQFGNQHNCVREEAVEEGTHLLTQYVKNFDHWSEEFGSQLCQCDVQRVEYAWSYRTMDDCLEAYKKEEKCHDPVEVEVEPSEGSIS